MKNLEKMFESIENEVLVVKVRKSSVKDSLVKILQPGVKKTKQQLIPIVARERFSKLNEAEVAKMTDEQITLKYKAILKTVNNSLDSAIANSQNSASFNYSFGPANGLKLIKNADNTIELVKFTKK